MKYFLNLIVSAGLFEKKFLRALSDIVRFDPRRTR